MHGVLPYQRGRGGYFKGNHGNNRPYTYEPTRNERNHNIGIKQFWCETCDRDFKSIHLLEQHKQQHQTCNIDGCKFVAHPKVITKHIQMQHSSGLFNKISKLNNPEEILKWREERKKKYPTKQNIELKIAQAQEKISRGEKLGLLSKIQKSPKRELKRSKKIKPEERKRRARHSKTPKCDNDNITNICPKNIEKKQPITKAIPEIKISTKLKPFTGIQEIDIESDQDEEVENKSLIEDDEFMVDTVLETEIDNKSAVCGALSNLINDYGSSDDESDSIIKPTVKDPAFIECKLPQPIEQTSNNRVLDANHSDSGSGPDEVKITKDTDVNLTALPNKSNLKRKNSYKSETRKAPPKKYKTKPPSTLLTKLLAKEIRQERNMVLQCVRYIVKNEYFYKYK